MRLLVKYIRILYHRFRQNYIGFRMTVYMKETGLFEKAYDSLFHKMDNSNQNLEYFSKNKEFFDRISEDKLKNIEKLLADDYSRKVWRATLDYRTLGKVVPKELISFSNEYFPNEVINLRNNEVFIDCGAYIGDTVQSFINKAKKTGIVWRKIIAFEPDTKWCKYVEKFFGRNKKIIIRNCGVYKSRGIIKFSERNDGAGRLAPTGTSLVNVTALDLEECCQDASFIKMDIEGAEMDALEGAKQLIMRNKPKLAICIYHSNEDMVRIIEKVHELVPEYRLYVRNHSGKALDTVLYAVK